MNSLIKIDSLDDLYSSDNTIRYQKLTQAFEHIYGIKPQYFARAPGRVNLIGEHIDYMGYGVLPFALEKDCLIAFTVDQSNTFTINHVDKSFPSQVLSVDPSAVQEFKDNYLKYIWAGYQAAAASAKDPTFNFGIKFLVSGNVPLSAGLSSSSSLVVCSGVACVQALQAQVDPFNFVDNLIKFERLAGTACGGMDQTISTLGKKGQALYIQFNPLKLTEVILPQGYSFVIANSMTASTKLATLGSRYNKRVCECRIGLEFLCKRMGVPSQGLKTLAQLQDKLNLTLSSMVLLVEQFLEQREYSFIEIEETLNQKLTDLLSDVPYLEEVLVQNKSFKLYDRTMHVFQEASRVLQFKEICNSNLHDDTKAILLGKLMNDSQKSCATLYECSSQEIDKLTTLCRENGALGSRLTGAGWGGCTVSLIRNSNLSSFVDQIKQKFFSEDSPEDSIFISQPANGAVSFSSELLKQNQ